MENSRLNRELKTVKSMISIYCRKHHGGKKLCDECRELTAYAAQRLEKCPLKAEKPTCARCTVHCYKPEMREKVRVIMRYSGPRMIYKHPILAILHLIDSRK